MRKLENNVELAPGNITLTLKGGICEYKVYGYATIQEDGNGVEYVILQPSDLRFNPVAKVPKSMIANLTCKF